MKTKFFSSVLALVTLLLALNFVGYAYHVEDEDQVPIADHYAGGKEKLLADIQAELKYPPAAKRNRVQGTCLITVDLMPEGEIKNPICVKNIGAGCGEEAIRVVNTLKFNAPGYQAKYTIPVKFKL